MARVEERLGRKFEGKLCSRCIQLLGGSRIDVEMLVFKERETTYSKAEILRAIQSGKYQDFALAFSNVDKSIAQIDKAILRLRDKMKIAVDARNEIIQLKDDAVSYANQTPHGRYFVRRLEADRHISKDSVRNRILSRDGGICSKCRTMENLTIDHIVSVLNGGSDEDSNLQILCRRCNSSKGSK
jgi:hypothetical protein